MSSHPAPSASAPARPQSGREELANAFSHGVGFLLAAASMPVVFEFASRPGRPQGLLGCAVFSATMMLVYFASTVYHALPPGRAKQGFRRLDHAAIFLFIAGSYTPFALHALHDGQPWPPFAAVWALALAGGLLKASGRLGDVRRSTLLYMALGWLAALAVAPTVRHLADEGVLLLAAGGAAYMIGAFFFLADQRLRYGHFVWHLFVLAGSGCHFVAALRHA